MSNRELVRTGQSALVKGAGHQLGKEAGKALIKTGGGGLLLGVPALLPFITLPMVLVVAILIGFLLYAKG